MDDEAMPERALTVVATGFSFLECPRWHAGRLWASDFYAHRVVAVAPDGAVVTVAQVPAQPSGLGWLPDGRLLVVSMRDRRVLRRQPSGQLVEHADLSGLASWHLNDMVVDVAGRAYVGSFGFDLTGGAPIRPAALIRVDPDGAVQVVADELYFPNGMVITPDGGLLIVAETFAQRLTAFDIEPDGTLRNRREWASFGAVPDTDGVAAAAALARLAPDGICLDADGAIWVADALFHRVVRVQPGGRVVEQIGTGEQGVYACMLGSTDGCTLYLCAAPSFAEHERSNTRDSQLLACQVDVAHAGLP